ncbi:MAG: S24 family peptidase [Pseudomonadota bacterium]|nr:S24 family peptidase [Pseudomonadota bacterium]
MNGWTTLKTITLSRPCKSTFNLCWRCFFCSLILIVDRALEASDKKVVIAVIDGELTVKRIRIIEEKIYLIPENRDYSPTEITGDMSFEIWGVVTNVIHPL